MSTVLVYMILYGKGISNWLLSTWVQSSFLIGLSNIVVCLKLNQN